MKMSKLVTKFKSPFNTEENLAIMNSYFVFDGATRVNVDDSLDAEIIYTDLETNKEYLITEYSKIFIVDGKSMVDYKSKLEVRFVNPITGTSENCNSAILTFSVLDTLELCHKGTTTLTSGMCSSDIDFSKKFRLSLKIKDTSNEYKIA